MRSRITSKLIAFGHNFENQHKVTAAINCTQFEQTKDDIITIISNKDSSNYNSEHDGEIYNHTVQINTPTSIIKSAPWTYKSRHSDDELNDDDNLNDNDNQGEGIQ